MKLLGIILLTVVVVALVWFVIVMHPGHPAAPVQSTPLSNSVYAVSKPVILSFPPIIGSSSVSSAQLPNDLKEFILASTTDVMVASLKYAGGGTGYEISFDIPNGVMRPVYTQLSQAGEGWQALDGSFSNLAFMLEKRDSKYSFRMLGEMGVNNIGVTIQAIKN